jgi:ATP-dependent RNA helicase RhlE
VNFELPRSSSDYVHRIGRTGRAGQSGQAVSLVSEDEYQALRLVEKLIGIKIPREQIGGFPA